jgi:2-polyprenyl-6-hydroxyphenyl methylase/3-demethylubiquinone-9 3-methyltransferase
VAEQLDIKKEIITFSFGKNWRSFVDTVSEDSIHRAMVDIEEWLGREAIAGKTVLDIGSGSGIHSLCYFMLGAKEILSLDVDPYSVESTRLLWSKAGQPANWRVLQGSILDQEFVSTLGQHEIVYSWGVLHHTGSMWEAIDNACSLVQPGGKFWIAIYIKGPTYPEHLELKKSYNRASWPGKKRIEWTEIFKIMRARRRAGQNPFTWNEKVERGMDIYHDLIDWLGGLPYEVASKEEIVSFCEEQGFELESSTDRGEGTNNIYLFHRKA